MVNGGAATTQNNGGYGKKVSLQCIAMCAAACAEAGELMPICMAGCLLSCNKSDSAEVKNCSNTCAKNKCSIFIGSGNFF